MAEVSLSKEADHDPSVQAAGLAMNHTSSTVSTASRIMNGRAFDPPHLNPTESREIRPTKETSTMSSLKLGAGHQVESLGPDSPSPIDPISRQILERTQSQHKVTQSIHGTGASFTGSGPSALGTEESQPVRQSTDAGIRRIDSNASSNKLTKDKKKGVSFLSRIMGNKKKDEKDDSLDFTADTESIISENRPAGTDAELFSQPIGFIPRFPAPPKYIKVKAQNRKTREFDKVFLAQILLGQRPRKNRTASDAKIVSIDDATQAPPPPAQPGNPASRAIWAMEFSKDGRYLAAAGQDKKLRVWEVIANSDDREAEEKLSDGEAEDTSEKLNAPVFKKKLIKEYEGHTSSILDLSWSKNNFLLSSSMDKTVRLYHISRNECLCSFKHSDFVTSIQFHPRDDRFFLAGSLDSKLRLWSIPDKNVAYWAQVPDMVTAVAFTPDGKTAMAGCLNGLCTLYDTEGLKAHSQLMVKSARGKNAKGSKITGIDTISLPPKEGGPNIVKLLITSNDSRIRIYDLKDRKLELKLKGNANSSSQIRATFSDDGKYVICGSEDKKVYIWPTGPVADPEKRPMEVFEASSVILTSALLAPTKTRQLLAQSCDPLYDLCNPPPVTLLSRSDSVISSKAPTDITGHSGKELDPLAAAPRKSDSPRRAPETPAYIARQVHKGGNLIITADYMGSIKVFRQDCAFQKRRQEGWDGNSVFSKKILARSGSVTTRTSVSSSLNANRNSTNLDSVKNPSTDRILNWRNSITSTPATSGVAKRESVSETNLKIENTGERRRSTSPRKSFGHRFSLRAGANVLTKSPPVGSKSPSTSAPSAQRPSITVQASSPLTAEPEAIGKNTLNANVAEVVGKKTMNASVAEQKGVEGQIAQEYNPVPHDPNDPLFLQGGQSFMYWNVQNSLGPMVNHVPRTPGLMVPGRNPLSRGNSVISELSSEALSRSGSSGEGGAGSRRGSLGRNERGSGGGSAGDRDRDGEGDLQCARCGNRTFRATAGSDGGKARLRCQNCGLAV